MTRTTILRFVDTETNGPVSRTMLDPLEIKHSDLERVVSIETVKDAHGYAIYRAWIAEEWQTGTHETKPVGE